MNLQSNALKFTKAGGKIKIKATLIKSEDNQFYNKKKPAKQSLQRSFSSGSISSD